MAKLGKCLLFYLKYHAEMWQLYEEEYPDVDGLSNPEEVLEKVQLAGDVAYREAKDLLESCAKEIEPHFKKISDLSKIHKRGDDWQIEFWITPKRAKASDREFMIGVEISVERRTLIPWVWRRGGRRAEDQIIRILGRGMNPPKTWDSGTVILKEIQIPTPDDLSKPIESDSLIKQIRDEFERFEEKDVTAIADAAKNWR